MTVLGQLCGNQFSIPKDTRKLDRNQTTSTLVVNVSPRSVTPKVRFLFEFSLRILRFHGCSYRKKLAVGPKMDSTSTLDCWYPPCVINPSGETRRIFPLSSPALI